MGFSTSGAAIVILIGILLALSVLTPALFSVVESTGSAYSAQSDHLREQANTEVTITDTEINTDADELSVTVSNDGSSSLSIEKTDVLINGTYVPTTGGDDGETTTVETNGDTEPNTDIWPPGTDLKLDIEENQQDDLQFDLNDSIRVTTETGVATTDRVSTNG